MNTTTGSPRRSTAKRFAMRGVLALILCLIASGLAFSDSNSNSSTRPRARRSATRKAASAVSADAQPALGAAQPTMKQMDELTARLQKLEEVVHQQQQELERERSMKAMDLMLNASQERPSGVLGEAPRSEAMRGCEGTPASGPNQSAQSAQSAQYAQKTDAVAAPAGGSAGPGTAAQEDGPLSLRIGRASISPVGFADLTAFYRSTNVGSSIGTNFGSIPFSNTPAGRLSETRLSAQKTQIGLRADVDVAGAHVIGYFDTDFFAAAPGNVAVPGNTFPNRILLAFADVRKGKFEILGGQSWSLLTPGRRGISPFWSDIFISKDVDINFQVGLAAARNGQFRFVYHPSDEVALAVSVENPEQYTGGSLGAGTITLPSALVTPYSGQLNNGTTTLSVPNLHPDVIVKAAFDPKWNGRDFHIEAAGVVRSFALFNPLLDRRFVATGGGALLGLNLEVIRQLHLISHIFYSDGGGRYTYGLAPDLVVRADGSPSLIHSASTITGFEAPITDRSMIFAYYGGVYIQRNVVLDPATVKGVGYGFAGSPSSNNRSIQEWTAGFNRTLWKNPAYGGLQFITQYSYLSRNPWSVSPGQPVSAHSNLFFIDFRYELPGAPPGRQ